jgi:hypothetical protein
MEEKVIPQMKADRREILDALSSLDQEFESLKSKIIKQQEKA